MSLDDVQRELDAVVTALLPELRATKVVDPGTFAELLRIGDKLLSVAADQEEIPKRLVGDAWFVFTAMLTEADYAADPDHILDAACAWQEKLRRAFGPAFD